LCIPFLYFSIKPGKVILITSGRFAGKKAIVVKSFDDGSKQRAFGHCLVAGLERAPQPVTRDMSKKKILKRSKTKPFIKFVNFNHMMPTRYMVNDLDLKAVLNPSSMKKADTRNEAKKELKKIFEKKYVFQYIYFFISVSLCCSPLFSPCG
jgi:large subunit ribosomal protein L27e